MYIFNKTEYPPQYRARLYRISHARKFETNSLKLLVSVVFLTTWNWWKVVERRINIYVIVSSPDDGIRDSLPEKETSTGAIGHLPRKVPLVITTPCLRVCFRLMATFLSRFHSPPISDTHTSLHSQNCHEISRWTYENWYPSNVIFSRIPFANQTQLVKWTPGIFTRPIIPRYLNHQQEWVIFFVILPQVHHDFHRCGLDSRW